MVRNDEIIKNSQDQLQAATIINTDFYNLTRAQIDKVKGQSQADFEISTYIEKLKKQVITLENISAENSENAKRLIERIKVVLKSSHGLDEREQKDKVINFWIAEQEENLESTNIFIGSIIANRAKEMASNEKYINDVKSVTTVLIAISLLIIAYVFYKIFQLLYQLRKSTSELKIVNKEFEEARDKIENTNWVLENSAYLADKISGIDESQKISNIVINLLHQQTSLQAAAIYIRKPDSYEFEQMASLGLKDNSSLFRFTSGEGLLGMIVESKEFIIHTIKDVNHLNTQTALVNQFPATVFISPLIHENHCLGIIEVAIFCKEEDQKKHKDYLSRISRIIATRIKFGQSHLLVEQLLEETQRQTEELEAQQEELRITNEELIHKTHLLESSEEELRVQQEELTQTNTELNQKAAEVEKRNNELNDAHKVVEQKINEVEQASKYKSEFMANMSHELRTPLNSILILAKLLQDNKTKNLNAEQVKYASVIHGAGTDLLELINELLDLAKIESGKIDLNIDNIYTRDFVNETEELFRAVAKDKGIIFTTTIAADVPADFSSDEYRLQQVVKNFLSNAFKFTPLNGSVSFNIRIQANNLFFEVKDSGKGITKEKQELIFEAFRQEDGSTSRKYGGTGLGLSISREIASLLGGRVTLESEPEIGSTFTLIIPYTSSEDIKITRQNFIQEKQETEKAVAQQALEQKTPEQEDRKILIIEDDINFADILKGFAEEYGFAVNLAHDGAKGFEEALQTLPDAIILDVMLPIADGWEVLKMLKENPKTKHIPVHMMSAATFNKKDFLEKGAIGFMHKPVTADTIQNTFETINLNLSQSVKKILLIEDQELQSEFIKDSFAEHNINVIQAFSLSAAWDKLIEEANIDCIILDMQLPDGNGLDLIEKIKETPRLVNIPIIINTAYELPKEQYDKIIADAKATILKSDKSSDRLIDEVNLFLNKINDSSYQPIKNIGSIQQMSNLRGKRVLVADDDMRNIFALTTSLQSFEMEIEIANNGKEAVQIMSNPDNKIDIILMDIMMPEMDGYEAIRIIREDLKYKNIPILAVTAKAMKGDREKSIQIGANDYVSKPIDIDKLTSLMQVWLG
ncbi:response regulator [Sphingobacterium faecale]|uniref:histidine kinase n=1 Tax=Sphingobacterium faecale TaxID=2803775 RepID=A0ABS1RAQ9_9SPHI|nr:response regulator [Sphingobacterium faecale]MBL1411324.1 response regulator [Sphingobacterium faecale]